MNCTKCNANIPPEALFCPKCGTPQKTEEHFSRCNEQISTGDSTCSCCGTTFQSSEQSILGNTKKKKAKKICCCVVFPVLALLLIVIVGYIILVFIANYLQDQIIECAKTQINLLSDALDQYRLDVWHYPSRLECLEENLDHEEQWDGPYIKPKVPLDPWGNKYYYIYLQDEQAFYLFTLGADNLEGGEGENADLGIKGEQSWMEKN